MDDKNRNKVFAIGLDGATFNIINPMIAKGQLPNIANLMQTGCYGTLKSCTPEISPPAWSSFMTGMHPGRHGILDFFGHMPESYEMAFFNATSRKEKPIWTLLSELGKKVCVINVPLTYPPDKVNGIMISGMDTPSIDSDFIYPSSCRSELDEKVGGYVLEMAGRNIDKNIDKYIESLSNITKNRFNVARYLMEKDDWDLFMVVFESADRAQHNFWKYIDPEHLGYTVQGNKKYGNVIFDIYKDLDAKLGELTNNLPDNSTIVVLSDHGFGPLYKGVRLNKWLESNSYSTFHPLNFNSHMRLWKVSLIEQLKSIMPKRLRKILSSLITSKAIKKGRILGDILAHFDMSKTKVYPVGAWGNLCINLKGRQPYGIVNPGKEYEDQRDEIIMKLKDLRDPATGTPVIDKIYKREEVYSIFPENTPDMLICWAKGYSFIGEREMKVIGIKADRNNLFTEHRWSGNHRPNGILIIKGKEIKEDYQTNGAEIVDVAPTILALLSVSIPDDMDGKVLKETISETFLNLNPIKYHKSVKTQLASTESAYSEEESEKIKKKLQELGYID